MFARYNHSPSYDAPRFWEEVRYNNVDLDTVTAGVTLTVTPNMLNDFRANWSRNTAIHSTSLTNFHGAVVPPVSDFFPSSLLYNPGTAQELVYFMGAMEVRQGRLYDDAERQLNFVDTYSWARGVHQFRFGIDYRHLKITIGGDNGYAIFPSAFSQLVAGTTDSALVTAGDPLSLNENNLSLFAQDTWKATNKLTFTYGLRWEINTPPVSATPGQPLYRTLAIFDSNPLAVVPGALWHTRFDNFAPRIGAAYQVTPRTVVRGGFGLYYDLGYGGDETDSSYFPYGRARFITFSPPVPFDLSNPAF